MTRDLVNFRCCPLQDLPAASATQVQDELSQTLNYTLGLGDHIRAHACHSPFVDGLI